MEYSCFYTAKFGTVSSERPKTRGRPLKHYHPLLMNEKHLETVVTFLCSIEEKLRSENKLPDFYKRYVDNTPAIKDVPSAENFLVTLNNCHPSTSFTMEIATNGRLPFVGIKICKKDCKIVTSVYRKATNTSLLLITIRVMSMTATKDP